MSLATDAVFYLKLNESSGNAVDATGNGRDFTNNNSCSYTAGKLNNCLAYQGGTASKNLTRADEAALSPTASATWSMWYNPSTLSGSTDTNICSKWHYSSTGSWLLRTNGTELEFYVDGSNSGITSGLGLSTGTWYHIVVVFNGSGSGNSGRLKIYVNGVEKTLTYTGTIPSALPDSAAPFQIGAWYQAGVIERAGGGAIDEFGFMNSAWSSDYVAAAYGSGTPPAYEDWASLPAAASSGVILGWAGGIGFPMTGGIRG